MPSSWSSSSDRLLLAAPRPSGRLLGLALFLSFDPEKLGFLDGKNRLLLARRGLQWHICCRENPPSREKGGQERREGMEKALGFQGLWAAEVGFTAAAGPWPELSLCSASSAEQGRGWSSESPCG